MRCLLYYNASQWTQLGHFGLGVVIAIVKFAKWRLKKKGKKKKKTKTGTGAFVHFIGSKIDLKKNIGKIIPLLQPLALAY